MSSQDFTRFDRCREKIWISIHRRRPRSNQLSNGSGMTQPSSFRRRLARSPRLRECGFRTCLVLPLSSRVSPSILVMSIPRILVAARKARTKNSPSPMGSRFRDCWPIVIVPLMDTANCFLLTMQMIQLALSLRRPVASSAHHRLCMAHEREQ
jgi:hypothetical protein